MNIILCGLPMCGKTTISKSLSKKIHWNCVDTDHLVEQAYAKKSGHALSFRGIYLSAGETLFRQLESCEILSLIGVKQHVIALGGGSLMGPENRKVLQKIGHIIYLKCDPSVLWKRIYLKGIPAFLDPHNSELDFYRLAENRFPLYEGVAQTTVDTSALSEQKVLDVVYNCYLRIV